MSIVSFWFFVFVAVLVVLYYVFPRKGRWFVLLAGSAFFIVSGSSWQLYLCFAAQVLLAYGGARLLKRKPKQAKWICGITVGVELAALVIIKENSFFIINANYLLSFLGKPEHLEYLNWVAPMAMSYYTLMLVSYVLDVHWGKIQPEKKPLRLLLYAGFFPQMVSGPIVRYEETANTLWQGHSFQYETFCFGVQRFLWGLFKKLVLAERLRIIVDTIYNGGLEGTWTPTGVYFWIGAIAYILQLYTDFSGAMDIVLGTAQLFGVTLPENFRTPFFSTSMAELWRRWHITLGLWLKDYIMYPFLMSSSAAKFRTFCQKHGGKKAAKSYPTYLGTLFVWLACGFWHGGTYRWIFWGLATFVVIVGGMILKPVFDHLKKWLRVNTQAESWTIFGQIRTFLLFALVCSVQPAESLSTALKMWKNSFDYNPWVLMDGSLFRLGLDQPDFWVLVFGLILLFIISQYQQKGSVRSMIAKQNLVCRWMLWIGLFIAVLLFGFYGEGYNPADFIYGGF